MEITRSNWTIFAIYDQITTYIFDIHVLNGQHSNICRIIIEEVIATYGFPSAFITDQDRNLLLAKHLFIYLDQHPHDDIQSMCENFVSEYNNSIIDGQTIEELYLSN